MNMQLTYLAALLDLVLGTAIFFVCFCRAVASNHQVLRRVRLKYSLLGPAALAFGLSPLWGDYPGWVNPSLLIAVFIGLLAETYQWKKGPPPETRLDTMPDELRREL